jgi:prohibitin 1
MTKKILPLFAVLLLSGCSIVDPGERGVSVVLGHASSDVLDPGPHLWIPFIKKVVTMNVQIQKTDIEASASSRDLQEVTTHAALNWHINPADSAKIFMSIGNEDAIVSQVIVPAFNETLKQATAKKTAEEVISRRAELKKEVDDALIERLKGYGLYVDDINIVDVKFGADFSHAIEAKQVAEQRAKQAVYEAQKAANDATAEINRAKGQSEAQHLLRMSLSDELLRLKAIEKWDGHFPQVMGQGSLPLLDLREAKK